MFKHIQNISDVLPQVEHKKEIRFLQQPQGITVGCYMFMDGTTFDSPEALECRGIAFDKDGFIVSRPLHKFFNIGEKAWLMPETVMTRDDIVAIYEKLDGSMIATSLVDGQLAWRSKKSFSSDVVVLAKELLGKSENANIVAFAEEVSKAGMTAIFELQHPDARIVVGVQKPVLTLLHVRDNFTGEYVLLNDSHYIHGIVEKHKINLVKRFTGTSVTELLGTLETMENMEGYVIQFANGDMVKVKCPWYRRLHTSITFLRERDIARLALNEELDDVKGSLVELGINLNGVEEVERKLRTNLTQILDSIDSAYESGKLLSRKDFAIANKGHQYFGLLMQRYTNGEVSITDWYLKNRLKDDFSLASLLDGAKAEAAEG